MAKKDLFSVAEIAERLDVHITTVQSWIRAGHFPNAYHKGPGRTSAYVVPAKDVLEFEKKIGKPVIEEA